MNAVHPEPTALRLNLVANLQVLVPCYTEALEIVTETVWAARMAQVPSGCTATVWLLDDGHDEEKQAWVSGMADPHIQYISGRRRPKGERAAFMKAASCPCCMHRHHNFHHEVVIYAGLC